MKRHIFGALSALLILTGRHIQAAHNTQARNHEQLARQLDSPAKPEHLVGLFERSNWRQTYHVPAPTNAVVLEQTFRRAAKRNFTIILQTHALNSRLSSVLSNLYKNLASGQSPQKKSALKSGLSTEELFEQGLSAAAAAAQLNPQRGPIASSVRAARLLKQDPTFLQAGTNIADLVRAMPPAPARAVRSLDFSMVSDDDSDLELPFSPSSPSSASSSSSSSSSAALLAPLPIAPIPAAPVVAAAPAPDAPANYGKARKPRNSRAQRFDQQLRRNEKLRLQAANARGQQKLTQYYNDDNGHF